MKVYFWLKERFWRILLWLFFGYFAIAALDENGSYWDAFMTFGFLYAIQYLGVLAFCEENIYKDKKKIKELADKVERL